MDAKTLRDLLHYNPKSGVFTWLKSGSGNTGKPAGVVDVNGYARIMFGSNRHGAKRYSAHRLAWLYVTGDWPPSQIDHINGDRSDNRFCNLRLATASQNQWNRGISSRNSTGYKRVYRDRGYWRAAIGIHGKQKYLGYFKSAEEASLAYERAAAVLHGQFARLS